MAHLINWEITHIYELQFLSLTLVLLKTFCAVHTLPKSFFFYIHYVYGAITNTFLRSNGQRRRQGRKKIIMGNIAFLLFPHPSARLVSQSATSLPPSALLAELTSSVRGGGGEGLADKQNGISTFLSKLYPLNACRCRPTHTSSYSLYRQPHHAFRSSLPLISFVLSGDERTGMGRERK